MKKHQLIAAVLTLFISTTAYAQDISIYIGNKNIALDTAVQTKEDTAYVPLSLIAKEMGMQIKWESPNVVITNGTDVITCHIGDKSANINGTSLLLSEAPYISNDRTFVSSADMGSLLDCKVEYQKQENRINITEIGIEERMNKLGVLDYCINGDWVYYVTLGESEGFHKMLLDGSQDTIIHDLTGIDVCGSTSVTSHYENGSIIYKFQQMSQYDENGVLGTPSPAVYYKLNLSDNSLTLYTSDNQN